MSARRQKWARLCIQNPWRITAAHREETAASQITNRKSLQPHPTLFATMPQHQGLSASSTNGIPRCSYPITLRRIPAPGRRLRTNIPCILFGRTLCRRKPQSLSRKSLHPPSLHHNGLRPLRTKLSHCRRVRPSRSEPYPPARPPRPKY